MFETELLTYLRSFPALSALVGNRIYTEAAPQKPTYPYIVYTETVDPTEYVLSGEHSTLNETQVQFDCYANTRAGVREVRDALREALRITNCAGLWGSNIQMNGAFREVSIANIDRYEDDPKVARITEQYAFAYNIEESTENTVSLLSATTTLTASQIKNLLATPVTLVPAPGAGKMLLLYRVVHQYKFGTVPYTSPDDQSRIDIDYGSTGWHVTVGPFAQNFITQSSDQISPDGDTGLNGSRGVQSTFENQPFVIYNNGLAEYADGDGTLIVTVHYAVVDLA